MDQIFQKIWELAKPYYEKGRIYDIPHVEWMMREAHRIADIEHADKKILLPIVILHDIGYSKQKTSNPNIKDPNPKIQHMKDGAKIAREILQKAHYDQKLTEKIVHYISVHDNWILGDDSPFQECKEMAIFNDLDFLYTLSNHEAFTIMGKSMELTPKQTYNLWLQDEKLTRRPFCCKDTKKMFKKFMQARKNDIEKNPSFSV